MLRLLSTIALLLVLVSANSQTADEIMESREYLWGKGNGVTLEEADQHALNMLVNQLSVHVESKFVLETSEKEDEQFSEHVHSIINSYSNATLTNTERIVIQRPPEAIVLRYIKRSDTDKIFTKRRIKIKEFCNYADLAIEESRISDAIKYYYWAFILLQSHPEKDEITYTDNNGNNRLLYAWLPQIIKSVLSNISVQIKDKESNETSSIYTLWFTYKGNPIQKMSYSYWTGQDNTNLIDARNGLGIAEYYGASAKDLDRIELNIEYMFTNESVYDKELHTVLSRISPVPFAEAYINIPVKEIAEDITIEKENDASDNISEIHNIEEYKDIMMPVIQAVTSKNYSLVKDNFTEQGFEIFNDLIKYGNARIVQEPNYRAMQIDNRVAVRGIPMLFSFKSNNKQFVEDVVFYFDENMKICDLSFSLSQTALNDVWSKEQWPEEDRLVIVDFLEHYKTAYALERLDYIESIFSDDALIIVGNYTVNKNPENPYKNNRIIEYNRFSKQEYLERLKLLFNSKEYVNIQFEQSTIRTGAKDHVYGIEIKQNYYSSNYGDEGYLFLLVDLQDSTKPVIHVRTWQPEPDAEGHVYGIGDF